MLDLINNPEMQTPDIKVASCTFLDLISSNTTPIPEIGLKGQLWIPEYQRPYMWNEKQINRLLNDFIEYMENQRENKPMFYLGSIILHKTDNGKLNIIDGQQRITTMLLINKIICSDYKSGIIHSAPLSIDNIKKNMSYLKAIYNEEVYEFQEKPIIKYIDFLQINVTLVVTATEDLAYTFFETQNTGGIRLSGSDIVKSHHLRAIKRKKLVNHQARRWEQIEKEKVESIMQYLSKIRYWDNRNWRKYPFYRDKTGIKSTLIDEFTEKTLKNDEDISYYYSAVKLENGRLLQMYESNYKQLKQPLSDGNNGMNYINEYIELHEMLFNPEKKDYRISNSFYEMVEKLMHGHSGTIFLKELLEVAIISYVSRFGFYKLFESSLWLFRFVYSLRVSTGRNVREDSVFKMVYVNQFIDNILEVHTVEQLHHYLKKFNYSFNTDNVGKNESKDKHIKTLHRYFGEDYLKDIQYYSKNPKDFDKNLKEAILKQISIIDDAE